MAEVQVFDEGGAFFNILDFGTFRTSLFGKTAEQIADIRQKLPKFKFRDGDVLLLGYPKAGNTWTFEILTMLLKGGLREDTLFISAVRGFTGRELPSNIHEKRVKIVFVARNPKDLAVSYFNMMTALKHLNYEEGTFSNWLPLFIRGDMPHPGISYFEFLNGYEQMYLGGRHNMLIVYYEDLKKNTLDEVERIADFLGLTLAPELLSEIANKCQFKGMKEELNKLNFVEIMCKVNKRYKFMRKGEVGNWKEWFTVAESETMDSVIQDRLHQFVFKFKYEL